MPGLFSQSRGSVRTLQVSVYSVVTRFAVLWVFYITLCIFYIILYNFILFYVLFISFYVHFILFYVILYYSMYYLFYVLFYIILRTFYIILCNFWVYMFTNTCHRVFTQLQLTNISISIYNNLHEDRYTFLIISRSFLLRMRNVPKEIFYRK
jgi:hypothetical protein